jgi:hypothetical protein
VQPFESPGPSPLPVEGPVNSDAVQPRGQRCIPSEIADGPVDLQKNLLHDVLALLDVKRDPKSDGKDLFAKPANQQLKRPFIAPLQP